MLPQHDVVWCGVVWFACAMSVGMSMWMLMWMSMLMCMSMFAHVAQDIRKLHKKFREAKEVREACR